jgi:hypothetical protein
MVNKEAAKVGIYEDNDEFVKLLHLRLLKAGHKVVGIVKNLSDLNQTQNMIDDGMEYAVVDGNLTPGQVSGNEGSLIIHLIKNLNESIVTIGFSAKGNVIGADYNIVKATPSSFKKVAELVSEIHNSQVNDI